MNDETWTIAMKATAPCNVSDGVDDYSRLVFVASRDVYHHFASLLQQGVGVHIDTGRSVQEVLCDTLGLKPDYIQNRIKTIFCNGKPVDDMQTAIVQPGDTLALSAAMPGLVGATFRSGGVLSPFRSGISYQPNTPAVAAQPGLVSVKLFNLLVSELGPGVLQRGIIVSGERLNDFFTDQDASFWKDCQSLMLNASPLNIQDVQHLEFLTANEPVLLRVISATQPTGD